DHDVILPSAYRKGNSASFIIPLLSIASVRTINSREPGAAEGAVTFGIWLSSSPNSLSKAFVKSYMDNFGTIPDDWATRGYAATSLLVEAFRRSPAYDYNSVRNSLADIRDFPTILGSFSFDRHGDAVYDPVVAVVRNSEFSAWPTVSK
ncbi:MAG: ABC transporter substrate-binding protein, partial [Rhodothermaceae bacterium]|nr:ABC transporter substrate-binding protein [Rhodothermaceae bacterium]MYI84583.1 ABC transporter substrate-binding protein [Rhodothermaceae bacterium]